jgi:hypothetical protein
LGLSATRLDYFGTTARRNSACEQCTLPRARKILTELLVGLRPGTAVIKHGEAILTLESEPRALVFWEGIEQGSTPLELTVPTDRPAEILAVAEGYQDYSNLFELKTGERRKVNIRLVRRRGRIEITSAPSGASIFLDGKPLTASGGQPLRTPSKIRPEYGKHTLRLKLEKHQDVQTQLSINRPNVGTKKYSLQPNPGRLIVRVPSEFKTADVYVNDRKIGSMGGKIAKSFEVKANVSLRIQAKRRDFESDVQRVKIEPEAFMKIEMIFPLKASLPLKAQEKRKVAEIGETITVLDRRTGLKWQKTPSAQTRNWGNAKRYCLNLSLGGYSDWELPSKDVLREVFAKKEIFDKYKHSSFYWSSSTYVYGTSRAWRVGFSYYLVNDSYKTDNYYVRCVRGGQ